MLSIHLLQNFFFGGKFLEKIKEKSFAEGRNMKCHCRYQTLQQDEACIIIIQDTLEKIKGKSFDEVIKIICGIREGDKYVGMIVPSEKAVYNSRRSDDCYHPYSYYPAWYVKETIDYIATHASRKGNFLCYTAINLPPLGIDYLKRAYCIRLKIDDKTVILYSGYPLCTLGDDSEFDCYRCNQSDAAQSR